MYSHLLFQGVKNFVMYKFNHLPQRERQIMHELARMFLRCLNHWKLETPNARRIRIQNEDISTYKMNYTRFALFTVFSIILIYM